MEYFVLLQDHRINDVICPEGISRKRSAPGRADELWYSGDQELLPVQYYLKEQSRNCYVDWLERPVQLASEQLKILLQKYQPDLKCQPVVLADLKRQRQDLYWRINVKPVDCLASQSEFKKDGTVIRLVLDGEKAYGYDLFGVSGVAEPLILVSLDLAESLLRRKFFGIRLRRVEQV